MRVAVQRAFDAIDFVAIAINRALHLNIGFITITRKEQLTVSTPIRYKITYALVRWVLYRVGVSLLFIAFQYLLY